jgi:cytochrome c-type biogenesis protein
LDEGRFGQEERFSTMFAQQVSYSAAFLAGLLSFFSPCILPLVPAYFTFITGFSLDELTAEGSGRLRAKVMTSTVAFVLGFSLVFILLGATASYLGGLFFRYQDVIRIVGGALIIVFGVHISGLYRLKVLDFEKRMHLSQKPAFALGTFLVGMAFGAGWSPCVGPFLGSILTLAAGQNTVYNGIGLLAVYSAGLAIPFLILSAFVHLLLTLVRRTARYMGWINRIAGGILIVVGLLLVFDQLNFVS